MNAITKIEIARPSTFAEKVAAFHAAKKACADHDREVHDPAVMASAAAIAGIPHTTTQASYVDKGERIHFSTEVSWHATLARMLLAQHDRPADQDDEFMQTVREIVALDDHRAAEQRRICDRLDMSQITDQSDRLGDAMSEAEYAVIMEPVSSLAELVVKIGIIQEGDCELWACSRGPITADIRRLAGAA